ncbi:MAG: hypothetical protein R3Y24_06570 [Eubacteriales bacterium]
MANNAQDEKGKVITKYERKIADRKAKAEADKKDLKKAKITGIAVLVLLIFIVVGGIGLTIYSANEVKTGTYLTVGEVEITKPEYEYYFNVTSNQFVTDYGQIFSMLGFDSTVDYAQQEYAEGITWKDYFDEMTVASMTRTIALVEEGTKSGFAYDATAGYESFLAEVEAVIAEYSITESEYYTSYYGEYAAKESVGELVKNSFYAEAYYAELQANAGVDDLEVNMTYSANSDSYDSVDYYSFTAVSTTTDDMTEEEETEAIELSKSTVEEFEARYVDGENFQDLAVELSGEAQKSIYEGNGGYFTDLNQSSVISATAEWLFDADRKSGDSTILYNEETKSYSFLVFMARYKNDTVDAEIKESLSTERVESYLEELMKEYELKDVKGEMNYLTISE